MSSVPKSAGELTRLRDAVGVACGAGGGALPFGIETMDARLTGGGLMLGGLHELSSATPTLTDDAAATLFAVGIAARAAARSSRRVLWALTRFDLYAPGLEQAGLNPGTLLFVEVREDKDVLAVMEDGLRHGGLAAVVGEVKRADMVATRRLQLAAMTGNTPALLSRRWRRQGQADIHPQAAQAVHRGRQPKLSRVCGALRRNARLTGHPKAGEEAAALHARRAGAAERKAQAQGITAFDVSIPQRPAERGHFERSLSAPLVNTRTILGLLQHAGDPRFGKL